MDTQNYTYMLRCGDGTLYTGWTNNLKRRLKAHSSGKGAKYTHSHQPICLAYFEVFESRREAMQREVEIKTFTKLQKEEMIQNLTSQTADEIKELNQNLGLLDASVSDPNSASGIASNS